MVPRPALAYTSLRLSARRGDAIGPAAPSLWAGGRLAPHPAPGACLVTDNVLTNPGPLGGFLYYLRGRPDCFSIPVPPGNGLELTVKVG